MLPPDAIDLFLEAAGRDPDKVAVRARETATYAALEARARRFAARFAGARRILIALPAAQMPMPPCWVREWRAAFTRR